MRIADYTVLDFHWSVESAEKLWTQKPEEILKERAERIRKDVKRYWRIEGKERSSCSISIPSGSYVRKGSSRS